MKHLLYIELVVTILVTVLVASGVNAAEGVKVFELGESGITIEFPLTPGEIAAEEAASSRFIVANSKSTEKSGDNVIVYEMGEGGHVVEFQATAKEIAAANAENARLAAFQTKQSTVNPLPTGDRFEMVENGNFIVFPPVGMQKEVENLVEALDKATSEVDGTQ